MPDLPLVGLELELTEQLGFLLNLGVAVAAALVGGAVAVRFGQPAVLGYVLAGVAIGPFTPGFVGDVDRISALADVGIVLLLFALGVQFSIRELREVRRVALPGGVAQIAIILAVGAGLVALLGFEVRSALVIGACLSISSTLVVLKSLLDRGEIDSLHGRTAIGWSIVQDIATIVFIVALPPLAGADLVGPLVLALGKAALFLAIAYLGGTRFLPWVFATIARFRSPELFLLAVVATALLTAFASSAVFGLSVALGAFVAGILVSESELSYQAAAEIIPFRDLFAVLFFVSVGMLVDPAALVAEAPLVALLLAVAVVGKGVLTAALGRALGLPLRSAILLGAAMSQVGEFSFLIAEEALDLGIFDAATSNLVLGTAVASILVSPIALRVATAAAERWEAAVDRATGPAPPRPGDAPTTRTELAFAPVAGEQRAGVVVLGAGRVGRVIVQAVRNRGFRCVVVDRDQHRLEDAARLGAATLYGDAANSTILARCGLERARVLVVAISDPMTARLATERARRLNPHLTVAARAHGRREANRLRAAGAGRVADPEAEAAFELARHALGRMGVAGPELAAILAGLRRDSYGPDAR
jgi:CPA2 family monovalent cation:H+ antiporter-2